MAYMWVYIPLVASSWLPTAADPDWETGYKSDI